MLLNTKEKKLKFLEELEVDELRTVFISCDGKNIGKVQLKWDKNTMESICHDRNLLTTFPLKIVSLSYCTEGCNENSDIQFVEKIENNGCTSYYEYVQNLVDEYLWSNEDDMEKAKQELSKIDTNEQIKHSAIVALRNGIAPKKPK